MSEVNNNNKEYDLLQSVDEERGLLQSTNDPKLLIDISKNSSMCDQPIQLSQSNLDDIKPQQKITNNSSLTPEELKLYNKISHLDAPDTSNETIEKVKEYINSFMDIFRWRRDYDTFGQLYTQIAFDGIATYFLIKQAKVIQQQRKQHLSDGKVINESMKQNHIIFQNTKQDSNVLLKGRITDMLAVNHINNKLKDKKYNNEFNKVFNITVSPNNNPKVNSQFEKDVKFNTSYTQNNMNLLTSISASVLTLFTKNIFKLKFRFEYGDKFNSFDHYFFGQKVRLSNNGEIGLKIQQIFTEFDQKKFNIEKSAYLISLLIASGVSFYFAVKLVKNLIYLAKKKKLFRKKYK